MGHFLSLFFLALSITGLSQNLRSGGVLKPEQANMDIRHYTIALDVDPAAKTINGYTEIRLNLLQPSDRLLLDLWHGLTISQVWINGKAQPFSHDKDDLIRIDLPQALPAQTHTVKIAYGGTSGIAQRPPWVGGFQWEKDAKGSPWISVSCQMEGGKIFFPCKDHPSDEPDEGADMIITVPKGLVATGPGLLQKTTTKANKSTYHWKTQYPISNYCLVFNAADYAVAKRTYTTINGNKVPMDYYVLQENKDKAEGLLDLYEQSARILEKYFGEYPWPKERMGMSETPHLGMEHQTNIAYGNKYRYQKIGNKDFDWLLHHEFGHEWWANKVTNKDWAHMWIQEGICTFGDAMATRELAGEEAYLQRMKATAMATQNRYPIVRGEQVDTDSTYHGDIYGKGAFFMHTLRYVIGDEVFFPTLLKLATDPQYTYHNRVTTADVEKLFSTASGKDLKPLFHLYLYTTQKLEIQVRETAERTYEIRLLNFDAPLPADVKLSSGTQRMELGKNAVKLASETLPVVDEKWFYLKRVIYE
ncbi:MAG TPA: M1 family metallopeptidase [Flavisolibacter sp.]|jgi:aminopeptidase N|nr:M1 family metallopeptidase [Flavisolibacter sp.]